MVKATQLAWAVMDTRFGRRELFFGTNATRNEAICALLWNYYGDKGPNGIESRWPNTRGLKPRQKAAWDKLYRIGYRAIRVRVTEL